MENGNEVHLSRLAYALQMRLTELYDKFRDKKELAPDGSFFQTNVQLAKWLHCTVRGIQKARRRLIEADKIRYRPISVKGTASLYWVAGKEPKKLKSTILPDFKRFEGTQ